MAVFDGATWLRRTLPLRNVGTGDSFTFSCWFNIEDGNGGRLLCGGNGTTDYVDIYMDADGRIHLNTLDSVGVAKLISATSVGLDNGANCHIVGSFDFSESLGYIYVNAENDTSASIGVLAGANIPWSQCTTWTVGAATDNSSPTTGSIYDLAFWPNVSVDLSDVTELQRFVAVPGTGSSTTAYLATDPNTVKPVGYGREGRYMSLPAAILFNGGFVENRGVGGKMTLTGGPFDEDGQSGPSPYTLFARWPTPGERWFASEQSGDPYPRSQTFIERREGLSSYGKLLGLEERDSRTRHERPGMNYSDLIQGIDEEDDEPARR